MHPQSNTPRPIKEKYLEKITSDFIKVADRLQKSSHIIRKKGGYNFPIFILSFAKLPMGLGTLLIDAEEMQNKAYYYATYLEALVEAQLIAADKVPDFQATYKDPDGYASLLVLDPEAGVAKVMFIPYPAA